MSDILWILSGLAPIVGAIALFAWKSRWKWFFPLVYVLIYLPFSLDGRFVQSNHGGADWRISWCPRGMVRTYRNDRTFNGQTFRGRQKTETTALGMLFWPLTLLDNLLWHRPPAMEEDVG